MLLEIGGTMEPCPPCKIILNGGFIAALAPVLAARSGWHPIQVAAKNLSEIATAYTKMLTTIGVAVRVVGDWEGCEHAKLLQQWTIDDGPPEAVGNKLEQMNTWAVSYSNAIADLVAGKLPSLPSLPSSK